MSGYVSPELERMAKRAALPISVRHVEENIFAIEQPFIGADGADWLQREWAHSVSEAVRLYLRLCESLDRATSSPGTEPADGCSATSAPEGGL